ncbi:MAG: hypothetical protein BWZ08_01725 [candidate division BRC1 bacterium ADurb.BinA292]|nr:MAG: hypothetical protein BWZ08_01725 [candidate division BRC1 bacterium ADurb.BinA292]
MARDINKNPYDSKTLTKLEIFEAYVREWLPVFIESRHVTRAAIWDFFAGSGRDSDGVPGSPLRILNQIESFKTKLAAKPNMQIRVVLNEGNSRKYADLSRVVEEGRGSWDLTDKVSGECRNADFQDFFRLCYPELMRQPNLILIDQYGIKHVNRDVFHMLIGLPKTDFLFFISSSYIKRFARTHEFSRIFPDMQSFQLADARAQDVHRIVLEYYRSLLPSTSATRLYPFTLRRGERSGNVYGLIFGSAHPHGVEKFLDVAWNRNRINGEANFDIDDDLEKLEPVFSDEFRRFTKRECFERDLVSFIHDAGERTNAEVYEFTLARGHPKAHAMECLRRLRREKKIDCPANFGISYKCCVSEHRRIVTVRSLSR